MKWLDRAEKQKLKIAKTSRVENCNVTQLRYISIQKKKTIKRVVIIGRAKPEFSSVKLNNPFLFTFNKIKTTNQD